MSQMFTPLAQTGQIALYVSHFEKFQYMKLFIKHVMLLLMEQAKLAKTLVQK